VERITKISSYVYGPSAFSKVDTNEGCLPNHFINVFKLSTDFLKVSSDVSST
jgi:hypothetical protein